MTSIDTETLFELWEKVKEYIPAKDKLDAAETFVKLCDDAGMEKDEINEYAGGDKILETAMDRYYDDEDEDYIDEEWN